MHGSNCKLCTLQVMNDRLQLVHANERAGIMPRQSRRNLVQTNRKLSITCNPLRISPAVELRRCLQMLVEARVQQPRQPEIAAHPPPRNQAA